MKRRVLTAAIVGAAVIGVLAACSGTSAPSTGSGGSKTLTVWYMQDSLSSASIAKINKEFTAETGAKVKVQIQQWDGINTKLTTALSADNPPDVFEMGNTDVPLFASSGALLDLTKQKAGMENSAHWLAGLEGPATVDGKLYAAPLYAGARAVVYNKKIWADAGVTTVPTTWSDFTADLDKIKAANTASNFSPFYLAGSNWFGGLPFLYDAGGALARDGSTWSGQLSTADSQKGLQEFKDFQNAYSIPASRTAGLATPDPNAVFSSGLAATTVGDGNTIKQVIASDPALKDEVGSFTWPTQNGTKIKPSFLGGSDVGIAANSKNQALALKYVKVLNSPSVQVDIIANMNGHSPTSSTLVNKVIPTLPDNMKAFYEAAKVTVSTPATPGWATIESDNSLTDFFMQVASGQQSVAAAAKSFDAHLNTALNASN